MINNILSYTKAIVWIIVLLALIIFFSVARPIAAQEPLADLRLLTWLPGGSFLLGVTPGQIATLPDGTVGQSQIFWQLAADRSEAQRLAAGFDPELSSVDRLLTFARLDSQDQLKLWGIDLASGRLSPHPISVAPSAGAAVATDPPGQVYLSPDGKKHAILVNEFFRAELWVGQNNTPAQLILSSQGEVLSDLAWHPASNALALIRTPLGSSTDTASELWRIDLPKNIATRLSQNNVADRSPVWNATGTGLAVVRNEQLRIIPSTQLMIEEFRPSQQPPISVPAPPIETAIQLTPPAAIRVVHHPSNTCRHVPVGQIDTIPFEEYVKRVVPYEVFPSWPAETLKAQAVAARTYGWDKYLQNPGGDYHVTDWVNHQYMCDDTVPSTNQAVDDTAGEYLAYNGQIITAMFSAEHASPTKTNPNVAYLQAVDDPVSFGKTRSGHGYGLGQWGAQRWAAWHNWSYQAILRHYYTDVTLEEADFGPASAPPNVSLVVPWSNHYLTGNKVRVLVNTSDDSGTIAETNVYLSTASETNLLFSEAGPANTAGYVIDVSSWADQVLLGASLVLTAEAFDAMGQRGISPQVLIGLDRVVPTALLTTATTLSGTTIITDSAVLSLTLTAADTTAGVTDLAMGRKAWEWEGEDLTRELVGGVPVGQVINDPDALNNLAMQATIARDPAGTWSSMEIDFPAPNQYRAYFRLKVGDYAEPAEVARLEVIDHQNGTLIGLHRLHGPDFRASGTYQEFHVDFDYPTVVSGLQGVPVIFRLTFQDRADIVLDRLTVVEHPMSFTASPTFDYPQFRLKVIDGAGNVSGDLLVLPSQPTGHHIYLPIIVKPLP